MKTTIISAILFILLLFSIYFLDKNVNNLCDTILIDTEKIETLVEKNDWQEAYNTSLTLISKLEEKKNVSSIYLNHTDYDCINCEALRLSSYIKTTNYTDSVVSVNVLKATTENIKNISKLTLKNIL